MQARKSCMNSLILARYLFIPLFQNNALAVLLKEVCGPSIWSPVEPCSALVGLRQ